MRMTGRRHNHRLLSPDDLRRLRTRLLPVVTAPSARQRMAPGFVAERLARCGVGRPPAAWCEQLSDDGQYCELVVDEDCKRCARAGRFRRFVRDAGRVCPAGRWGPADETGSR